MILLPLHYDCDYPSPTPTATTTLAVGMSTTTHCYYGADDDEADDDRVDRSREGPRVHGRGTDRTRCWAALWCPIMSNP